MQTLSERVITSPCVEIDNLRNLMILILLRSAIERHTCPTSIGIHSDLIWDAFSKTNPPSPRRTRGLLISNRSDLRGCWNNSCRSLFFLHEMMLEHLQALWGSVQHLWAWDMAAYSRHVRGNWRWRRGRVLGLNSNNDEMPNPLEGVLLWTRNPNPLQLTWNGSYLKSNFRWGILKSLYRIFFVRKLQRNQEGMRLIQVISSLGYV